MSRVSVKDSASTFLTPTLLFVALTCSGCGASSTSGGAGSPVVITTRTAMTSSPAGGDHHLTVSASCQPGEQLVAGGYAAVGVFESDYTLLATYPSAATTWTVRANSGSSYQLQAIVYCLASYPSLGIQIHQASVCPAGTVRLSMGFQGAISYVVCSAHGATPTANGFRLGSTEVDCMSHATGTSSSESRTFSYTCVVLHAAA